MANTVLNYRWELTNFTLPLDLVKRFVVLYNGEDHVTEYLAPTWTKFINVMPLSRMKFGKHLWGSAGRDGFDKYWSESYRATVIQLDTDGKNSQGEDHYVEGHSAVFKTAAPREYWFGKAFIDLDFRLEILELEQTWVW